MAKNEVGSKGSEPFLMFAIVEGKVPDSCSLFPTQPPVEVSFNEVEKLLSKANKQQTEYNNTLESLKKEIDKIRGTVTDGDVKGRNIRIAR